MADSGSEDRSVHKGTDAVRQQQIGNRLKLVSRRGMSGNVNAQFAQVLDGAPDLGPRGTQFLGNAGSTDDKSRIVAQEANDAAEASVSEALG